MALTMAMAMAMVVTMAKTMSMTEVILVTLFQWMDIDDDKDTGQSMTMLMTMLVLMLMLMLTGASMARLLTDSDTEAMIQRVQPEERDEVKISIVCLCCLFSLRAILLVQQTLLLHTQQVNVLIEKHKELRRKKSANSFRREGVTQVSWKTHTMKLNLVSPQRPQALSGQQTSNGDLPPIGLIEEKEENSTAL